MVSSKFRFLNPNWPNDYFFFNTIFGPIRIKNNSGLVMNILPNQRLIGFNNNKITFKSLKSFCSKALKSYVEAENFLLAHVRTFVCRRAKTFLNYLTWMTVQILCKKVFGLFLTHPPSMYWTLYVLIVSKKCHFLTCAVLVEDLQEVEISVALAFRQAVDQKYDSYSQILPFCSNCSQKQIGNIENNNSSPNPFCCLKVLGKS